MEKEQEIGKALMERAAHWHGVVLHSRAGFRDGGESCDRTPCSSLSPHATEAPESLLDTNSNPTCPLKRSSLQNGHLHVSVLKPTVTTGPDLSPGSSYPAPLTFS